MKKQILYVLWGTTAIIVILFHKLKTYLEKKINKLENITEEITEEPSKSDNKKPKIDFNELYQKAIDAIDNKDPNLAIKYLDEIPANSDLKPGIHYHKGLAYVALNKDDKAIDEYLKAIKYDPNAYRAMINLGNIYRKRESYKNALQCYDSAEKIKPNDALIPLNRGFVYEEKGNNIKAEEYFEKTVELDPKLFLGWFHLARMYSDNKKYAKSIEANLKALKLIPNDFDTLNNLGVAYLESAQLDKAAKTFKLAIKINPASTRVYRNLSVCEKFPDPNNKYRLAVEDFLKKPNLNDAQKIHLYFALGKMANDCDQYDLAFETFQKANLLKFKEEPINKKRYEKKFEDIINKFSTELLNKKIRFNTPDVTPIFIMGTPRAGKSLLEKILSQHPKIEAAGEVGISRMVTYLPKDFNTPGKFPKWCDKLDDEIGNYIIEKYIERLTRDVQPNKYIIDTMPGNYFYIGLLHLLFPNAKFIYASRDPLDACLIIYFKYFAYKHRYSYDLSILGHYYRLVMKLVNHWKTSLPNKIHQVQYEDLIHHPEETLASVLEYLELSPENITIPHTLHADEIGRWQKYHRYLNPLIESLKIPLTYRQTKEIKTLIDQGVKEHVTQNLSTALDIYQEAIEKDPNNPAPYYLSGVIYHQKGLIDNAISLMQRAIELNPYYYEAHQELARIFEECNQADDANKHRLMATHIQNIEQSA